MFKTLDMMKKRDERGFTLIELLIVIAIIAILAAIAIPQFAAYRERGIRATMVADARNAATNLEAFFGDCQIYPAVPATLGPNPAAVAEAGQGSCLAGNPTIVNFTISSGNTLNSVTAAGVGGSPFYTITVTNPNSGVATYGNTQLIGGPGAAAPGCTWTASGTAC